jgi:hypothetical protein
MSKQHRCDCGEKGRKDHKEKYGHRFMKEREKEVPTLPRSTSHDEIAEEMRLTNEMISDLTGLEDYNAEQAPTAIHELAAHLIRQGWKR